MASMYFRLMDAKTLSADDEGARADVLDAGAFKTLELEIRVIKTGTDGEFKLRHAATLESDAWLGLGSAISLTTATTAHVTVSNFLRFVSWEADSSVDGSPVAIVDAIAKN
jgi:hypothetical protein